MRRLMICLTLCLLLTVGAGASAQQPGVPIIGVTDGVLTIFGVNANTRIGDDTPFYFDIAASRDGAFIAYTAFPTPESSDYTLTLLPQAGNATPVEITQDISPEFPAAFDANGQFLYYVRPGEPNDEQPMQLQGEIMRLNVFQPDTPPESVASFPYEVGCGGGSPYPMDSAYSVEAGLNGNALTFLISAVGVVHSTGCNGVGVALTNIDSGETTVLSTEIGRGSLSADGTQMAGARIVFADGRQLTELVIVDLTDGSIIPTQTENMPDRVHWGADGGLYYTTRARVEKDYGLTDEQAQTFQENTGIPAEDIPSYEANIYRYNIVTGQSEPVYSAADTWGIGRLDSTPTALYFSQLPDAGPWLDALFSDEFDAATATDEDLAQRDRVVHPDIYRLSLMDGDAERVLDGVQNFTIGR